MMILLISGSFDLSVGSVAAFSGGIAAYLMHYYNTPVVLSIAVALIASVTVGLVNGY